ncbi:hypothetical protein M9H77_11250 [Catharanthus roseus]|uniref:Uncharacterized protein n=1 Tax=Catharanthus roseus TaxID=4058 RepID=A0ACC0BE36_CATRO|nr:hypothetical protein M9H77_11250 [Catharanthus roseus]
MDKEGRMVRRRQDLDDKEYKATTNYILLNSDEVMPLMEKPVNTSNNECLKCLSWGSPKHIRTLVHESDELESVDIRGRSSIGDEDEEEVEWESDEKEEEEFQSMSDSET